MSVTAQTLGRIGLPEPVSILSQKTWDAIIVGAGHNGLACAAYLAREGKRVLVLERSERVGGACTLEEPWPGYRISPCAYLCGLLHPLIVTELDLPGHGFEWIPASPGMFVPFDDGTSIQLWNDGEKCDEAIRAFAPQDLNGWLELGNLISMVRDKLRPDNDRDVWIGDAPTRDQIEDRLGRDPDAMSLLFEWSMSDLLERYLDNEKLHLALLGQGVIGTAASPFDPGTAYIRFHHACGRMFGRPGEWGYVKGGMGMVSFILCDIARKNGATVATGTPVSAILPGQGVELAGGDVIHAPIVISNADPKTTRRLAGSAVPAEWAEKVEAITMQGCTVKLNVALSELPDFTAKTGLDETHHRGQINTILDKPEWHENLTISKRGQLPDRLWTELYFQSALDRSIVPKGKHVMSVFAQYVPHTFDHGDWETRKSEVIDLALSSIARYAPNVLHAVEHVEAMGPPDIETKTGLTGGHIFQGDCLPDQMWSNRLNCETGMDGVFMCGAGTHPGGNVIGINGRNCAMRVLGRT